jgi:hypothetical protein
LGWKLRIRRFFSHFCIGTYFTNDFMEWVILFPSGFVK